MRNNEEFCQKLAKEWNEVYRKTVRDVDMIFSCDDDIHNKFLAYITITFLRLDEIITFRVTFYRDHAEDIPLFVNRLYRMAESTKHIWDPISSFSH